MSKYVKGSYRSVANEEYFYKIINLKECISMIAGFEQNTMVVTAEDIQYCEDQINKVKYTLDCWFENKLESLKLL